MVVNNRWNYVTLGSVVKTIRLGGNYKNSKALSLYPLIKMGNISRGNINLDKIEYIQGVEPNELDELRYGDILFNTRNTPELVGKVAVWRGELPHAYYNSNLMRIEFDNCSHFFMNYLFNTKQMIKKMQEIAIGTTSVAAIYTRDLYSVNITLPPLHEQRAIAATLSDADAYIYALEKLIAKKRGVKQGAMQELLTGKQRLPGFKCEWVEKPLFQIADDIIMGQSPDSRYYNNVRIGLPLVQGNADVENRLTIIRFFTSIITKQGSKGDIILTVRAPVGNVAKADFDCCLGRGVCAIKGNDFLYQLLIYFEPQWGAMSTGSTFDSISGNELREVMFIVPTDDNEQTAIAKILSDMDMEIDALMAKLEKAKHIKHGIMSELLTGRIRLVEEDVDSAEDKRS